MTQRKTTAEGESREDILLKETASIEADLTNRIAELQVDIKKLEQKHSHTAIENDRLHVRHSDLNAAVDKMEAEKKCLKDELREGKFRESRLLQDYSELEEENIAMQQQVGVVIKLCVLFLEDFSILFLFCKLSGITCYKRCFISEYLEPSSNKKRLLLLPFFSQPDANMFYFLPGLTDLGIFSIIA